MGGVGRCEAATLSCCCMLEQVDVSVMFCWRRTRNNNRCFPVSLIVYSSEFFRRSFGTLLIIFASVHFGYVLEMDNIQTVQTLNKIIEIWNSGIQMVDVQIPTLFWSLEYSIFRLFDSRMLPVKLYLYFLTRMRPIKWNRVSQGDSPSVKAPCQEKCQMSLPSKESRQGPWVHLASETPGWRCQTGLSFQKQLMR